MQRKRQQCRQETVWWCGGNRSQIEWVRVWSGTREQKRHLGSPAEESNGQIARAGSQNWGGFVFRLAEPWEYFWNEEKTSGRTCGEEGTGELKLQGNRTIRQEIALNQGRCRKAPFPPRCRKAVEALERFFWGDSRLLTVLDRLTSICLEFWWQNER